MDAKAELNLTSPACKLDQQLSPWSRAAQTRSAFMWTVLAVDWQLGLLRFDPYTYTESVFYRSVVRSVVRSVLVRIKPQQAYVATGNGCETLVTGRRGQRAVRLPCQC